MWGVVVLFLSMVFHPRSSSSKRKGKTKSHRKFYRDGRMTDELDALDALHDTMEFEAFQEKKRKK